ncbi:MAG: hypothetical protein QOD50_842 [Actinomycetota bacterium]|nr:hypothetical protein [Actinomycetota bacterium]
MQRPPGITAGEDGRMNRSGSIVVAVATTAVVVAGIAAVAALALLPAQSSGPVGNVASIVISPRVSSTPTSVATPDDHGTAVPVKPAGPAVVEPEHGGDDGGHSGKGKSGGNG